MLSGPPRPVPQAQEDWWQGAGLLLLKTQTQLAPLRRLARRQAGRACGSGRGGQGQPAVCCALRPPAKCIACLARSRHCCSASL